MNSKFFVLGLNGLSSLSLDISQCLQHLINTH